MNNAILLFIILSYTISWSIWIPEAVYGNVNQLLMWVAGFGPTLAALLIITIENGRRGLKELFKFGKCVNRNLILFSIFGTPLVLLISLGLHIILGGKTPQFSDPNHLVTSPAQWPLIFVVFAYIFIFTALGEEIGWRGFFLPRLQRRFSLFTTSIIIGLVWAFWHLPLFWIAGDIHQQLTVSWFILQIFGSTFIYSWMYIRTNGNLLASLLFHTSSNAAIGLLPVLPLDVGGSLRPLWLTVCMLWLAGGLVLFFERKMFFSKDERNLT